MKKLLVYKPAVKKLLQSLVSRCAFGGSSQFFHKRKPIPDLLAAIVSGAKILSISVFRNANFGIVGKGIAANAEIAAVYSWQQLNVSKPCLRTPYVWRSSIFNRRKPFFFGPKNLRIN